ncbi:BMA-UNC-44, isoform h [Dirofilaria immitis]|nr:BMA-UNC-44, isoform h [Dirofilaria immitis]
MDGFDENLCESSELPVSVYSLCKHLKYCTVRLNHEKYKIHDIARLIPSDTIGSVKNRIAIFETLSTDNQLASSRKSDNLPELVKAPKHERHSPFREGPNESHDEPKAVSCKSESDQFDVRKTGKIAAQKHMLAEHSDTAKREGLERAKTRDQETNSEVHAVERWENDDEKKIYTHGKTGMTLDSESTTWKILAPIEEHFGLENILPESEHDDASTVTFDIERQLDFLKKKISKPEVIILSSRKEMSKIKIPLVGKNRMPYRIGELKQLSFTEQKVTATGNGLLKKQICWRKLKMECITNADLQLIHSWIFTILVGAEILIHREVEDMKFSLPKKTSPNGKYRSYRIQEYEHPDRTYRKFYPREGIAIHKAEDGRRSVCKKELEVEIEETILISELCALASSNRCYWTAAAVMKIPKDEKEKGETEKRHY